MRTLVIYDTKFGNTERIAQAIARGAGGQSSVRVTDISEAAGSLAERPDLVIIGGPTQRRGLSPELRAFVEALPPRCLEGVAVASFDTRYRGSTLIMGSAAREAAKRLQKAGGHLTSPPESFFVDRSGPIERQTLADGEVDRAEAWGRAVGATVGELAPA